MMDAKPGVMQSEGQERGSVSRNTVEASEAVDCSERIFRGEVLRVTDPRSGAVDPGFTSRTAKAG